MRQLIASFTSGSLSLRNSNAPRQQFVIATAIGIVAGLAAYALIGRPGYTSDLAHFWFATRTLAEGGNPYTTPLGLGLNPGQDPALYPLPAYMVFAPFALLPMPIAGGVFVGLGSFFAALGVSRTGPERFPLFLSAPFVLSVSLGQWSAWLLAATLLPWLGWVAVAKPTVGLATWVARPSWRTAAVIAAVGLASLLIQPDWLGEWLSNVTGREEKFIPVLRPGGFVLLAAIVAWRRAEGRLFLAMILVPQTLLFYDQLLLWLVPRTLRQSLVLSLYSVLAFVVWWQSLGPGEYYVQRAVPWAFSLYLVAGAMLVWNWWKTLRRST